MTHRLSRFRLHPPTFHVPPAKTASRVFVSSDAPQMNPGSLRHIPQDIRLASGLPSWRYPLGLPLPTLMHGDLVKRHCVRATHSQADLHSLRIEVSSRQQNCQQFRRGLPFPWWAFQDSWAKNRSLHGPDHRLPQTQSPAALSALRSQRRAAASKRAKKKKKKKKALERRQPRVWKNPAFFQTQPKPKSPRRPSPISPLSVSLSPGAHAHPRWITLEIVASKVFKMKLPHIASLATICPNTHPTSN